MIDSQGKLKLNIGCGKDYRDGWLNVDINHKFKADIYEDILTIEFASGTFDVIVLVDVIAFINPRKVLDLFSKCSSWLKPRGIFIVATSHLRNIAKILTVEPNNSEIYHEALCWLFGTDYKKYPDYETNHGQWCYSSEDCLDLFEKTGFEHLHGSAICVGFGQLLVAYKPDVALELKK